MRCFRQAARNDASGAGCGIRDLEDRAYEQLVWVGKEWKRGKGEVFRSALGSRNLSPIQALLRLPMLLAFQNLSDGSNASRK